MPHYEIHHSCGLTQHQRHALATAITTLHCTLFSAPSAFVNVSFHANKADSQDSAAHSIFVGGKPVWTNYMHAHLRPRGPNNKEKLNTLVEEVMRIWDEEARPVLASGRLDDPRGLHNVFIMEDITAGAEQGFILPIAGQDGKWVEENLARFQQRAQDGDESMRTLIDEASVGFGRKRSKS
ncbi:hypothetical protein BKA66DRAFT_431266 [Pyrenochaeta sp. MPI-SDFR-AT-0127]|nr:hypothetical protein BKA66DRAFT_431266 [Pyrenochaeta sp. MPI-SDFR-AT-0127]